MVSKNRIQIPRHMKIAKFLLMLLGFIWIVFGIFSTWLGGETVAGMWVIVIMMFGDGLAYLGIGFLLHRFPRLMQLAGLGLVAVNIILTFTDQLGFFDYFTFVLNLAALYLLVRYWSSYKFS